MNNNYLQVIVIDYVLGFMFSPDLSHVVLIEKQKPEFQKGKWNGVGGKIESGETPMQAIAREFEEETGLATSQWTQFGILEGLGFNISLFFCMSPWYNDVQTTTDEEVGIFDIEDLFKYQTMPNLSWLIPMARHTADGSSGFPFLRIKEEAHMFLNYNNGNSLKPDTFTNNG